MNHLNFAFIFTPTITRPFSQHPLSVSRSHFSTRSSFLTPKSTQPLHLLQYTHPHPYALSLSMQVDTDSALAFVSGPYADDESTRGFQNGVRAIRQYNDALYPLLEQLRQQPYFRLFRADLLGSCGYFPQEEEDCALESCEVLPADEEIIPKGMPDRDIDEYAFELDGWVRWDMPSGFSEYYDVWDVREGFTGYDGSKVWQFIHGKICFQKDLLQPQNKWKVDFNRAVSGFHSSVSCHIVEDILLQGGDQALPNALQQYRQKLRDIPGAIQNLYYGYLLMLCAIADIGPRLYDCDYLGANDIVRKPMRNLLNLSVFTDERVQWAAKYLREHAASPDAKEWKARLRTRDLLRIMNCVQCNRCRLHGKTGALGLASALKVIIGEAGEGTPMANLKRIEIAAIIVTAGKFAHSCKVVEQFMELDKENT